MIQAAKIIETGLTGVGIGVVFGALILGVALNPALRGQFFSYVFTSNIRWIIHLMPMPGVKCPTCLERGTEQWVIPGKHCPNCSTACRNLPDLIIHTIYLYFYGYISAGFLFYIILLII